VSGSSKGDFHIGSKTDQYRHLRVRRICSVLTECLHRLSIVDFGEGAVVHQRRGDVVGHRFFVGKVAWAMSGNNMAILSSDSPRFSPAMT
jgi:hypothetical protein